MLGTYVPPLLIHSRRERAETHALRASFDNEVLDEELDSQPLLMPPSVHTLRAGANPSTPITSTNREGKKIRTQILAKSYSNDIAFIACMPRRASSQ
jgi:hypothetical protein